MTGIQRTLIAISACIAVALGLFIWFIANWDKTRTEPIGTTAQKMYIASIFSVSKKSWGLGQSRSPAVSSGGTST